MKTSLIRFVDKEADGDNVSEIFVRLGRDGEHTKKMVNLFLNEFPAHWTEARFVAAAFISWYGMYSDIALEYPLEISPSKNLKNDYCYTVTCSWTKIEIKKSKNGK